LYTFPLKEPLLLETSVSKQQLKTQIKKIMKKVLYPLIALILFWASGANAQTGTNPCAGKANFQFTVNSLTVNFFSISTSNTELVHRWHFGAGTAGSDAANPVFTYNGPGIYKVTHYIKDVVRNCYDSAIKEIRVGNICELFTPKFEWAKDSANPARIKFYNVSQPNPPPSGVTFKWSFGDGTSSSEHSPIHIYSQPGEYEVCLIMRIDGVCEKRYCTKVIVPLPCNLQPNFIWAADANNPLKIKFTNQTLTTTPNAQVITWQLDSIYPLRGVQFRNTTAATIAQPLRVRWDFGDGTESNEWSPFHKYEKAGTYKVCLKIAFFEGCTKEVCKTVVVPEPLQCERFSNFEVRVTSEPNTIKAEAVYVNSSLKYVWTFGDGTGAFTPGTDHKYARPGKYTVCLTVYRGENCASTTCKEITVGPLPCSLTNVKYEYQRLNSVGNVIQFKAVSNQPILSQRWTIQRDNGATPVVINANNPTYTFTQAGIYKVCLRALTINGCIKEFCDTIRIGEIPNTCSLQVTPNPATTQIYFRLELRAAQTVTASIIDQSGVRRSVHFFSGTQGWNNFNIGIGTLPAGYYTVEVKYNGIVCATKFQKVN